MEKEFVTYELALRMKQLGFDEPCFMYWWKGENEYILADIIDGEARTNDFKAPLFQQAFRWFREKYNVHIRIEKYDKTKWWANWGSWTSEVYDSYEESELACLEKLIEIVEQK